MGEDFEVWNDGAERIEYLEELDRALNAYSTMMDPVTDSEFTGGEADRYAERIFELLEDPPFPDGTEDGEETFRATVLTAQAAARSFAFAPEEERETYRERYPGNHEVLAGAAPTVLGTRNPPLLTRFDPGEDGDGPPGSLYRMALNTLRDGRAALERWVELGEDVFREENQKGLTFPEDREDSADRMTY